LFQNGGQTEKGTDDQQLGATHSSGAKAPQTKAWLKPYSNETGTEIRQDSPTDYAKLQSMVENNQVIWDLVNVCNDFGLESTAKLLEPLDSSVFDKEPILQGYASKYRVACMLYTNTLLTTPSNSMAHQAPGLTSSIPRSSLDSVASVRAHRKPWR
jgi:spermidine/putrescine-binding protein